MNPPPVRVFGDQQAAIGPAWQEATLGAGAVAGSRGIQIQQQRRSAGSGGGERRAAAAAACGKRRAARSMRSVAMQGRGELRSTTTTYNDVGRGEICSTTTAHDNAGRGELRSSTTVLGHVGRGCGGRFHQHPDPAAAASCRQQQRRSASGRSNCEQEFGASSQIRLN